MKEKLAGAAGIPSNQQMVDVAITRALQHRISWSRLADLLSFNQAKCFGLQVPKRLVSREIEWGADRAKYNQGKVVNPWTGEHLCRVLKY